MLAAAMALYFFSLMRSPVDDGTSIRLYEKVFSLACQGGCLQSGFPCPRRPSEGRCRLSTSFGHRAENSGSLVPPPTERTGLLSALVGECGRRSRASHPSGVAGIAAAVLDVAVAYCSEVSRLKTSVLLWSRSDDAYAPWLIQPFCSARLQPQIVIPDPKAMSALSDSQRCPVQRKKFDACSATVSAVLRCTHRR